MGIERLASLERELNSSYTESISFSMESSSPHIRDALEMLGDRILSLSLRKQILAG
jgi:hypothetical protein